jgi:hypothetical protein
MKNEDIDRLLRAAAAAPADETPSMPFGFDTRVVAQWRSGAVKPNGVSSLLRRVALLSAAVLIVSSVAAFRQIRDNSESGESFSNEFALADSAIQDEFSQ